LSGIFNQSIDGRFFFRKEPFAVKKPGVRVLCLRLIQWQLKRVSHATMLAVMSEIGPDGFKKFDTSKHFVSWARLATNNKISGGKVLSSRIPKGSNRLKIALSKLPMQ